MHSCGWPGADVGSSAVEVRQRHFGRILRAHRVEGMQACAQLAIGPRQHQRIHRHLAAFLARDELEALGKKRTQHAAQPRARSGRPACRRFHRGDNIEAIARRPARPSKDLKRVEVIRVRDELLQCGLRHSEMARLDHKSPTRHEAWDGLLVWLDGGDFESLRRFRDNTSDLRRRSHARSASADACHEGGKHHQRNGSSLSHGHRTKDHAQWPDCVTRGEGRSTVEQTLPSGLVRARPRIPPAAARRRPRRKCTDRSVTPRTRDPSSRAPLRRR